MIYSFNGDQIEQESPQRETAVGMDMPAILVVDDSKSYRFLLVSLLRKWNFTVFEAEDGQQALEMINQHAINMVISDWEMPVMDGVTLCSVIRQQAAERYIYLMLVTARQSVEDIITGLKAGADDFLSKPVNQNELHARLHAGMRILALEATLAARNETLSQAYQQIEDDLKLAAKLQRSMLPAQLFTAADYQAQWMFLPSAYVSGDMLNFFPLGDQHIGFYSVDVAGHGVGAAMLSLSVVRQFLQGRTIDNLLIHPADNELGYEVVPPYQVVTELNRRFCIENEDVNSYFTLIYGVIDIRNGQGVLCQAGHPTPFIVRATGEVVGIGEGGSPVGLLDILSYQDSSFYLLPGDRLYLFTDGISECENEQNDLFGERRLQDILSACTNKSVTEVFEQVQQLLTTWHCRLPHGKDVMRTQTTFSDDISLLVIERLMTR